MGSKSTTGRLLLLSPSLSLSVLSFFFIFSFLLCTLPIKTLRADYMVSENSGDLIPGIDNDHYSSLKATDQEKDKITPLHNFISEAKKSLTIAIYEVKEKSIQAALIEALTRGVVIKMLVEPNPVGNGCDAFSRYDKSANKDCEESAAFTDLFYEKVSQLQKKYPALRDSIIRYYNKNLCGTLDSGPSQNCFMHGKIVLRDDQDALISTGNFSDSSLCLGERRLGNSCNRDYTLVWQSSEIVTALKEVLALDMGVATKCDPPPKKPRKDGSVRKYTEGRCFDTPQNVNEKSHHEKVRQILKQHKLEETLTISPVTSSLVANLIKNAKKSIRIETQYLKETEWQAEILNAMKRGVKVEATLASLCNFNKDKNGAGWIKYKDVEGDYGYIKRWLNPLRQNRLMDLKFFTTSLPDTSAGNNGYVHSKVLIIDDQVAWIGSINGSNTSTHSNREFGMILKEKGAVDTLIQMLQTTHQSAMTIDQHVPSLKTHALKSRKSGEILSAGQCHIEAAKTTSTPPQVEEEQE